MLPMCFGFAGPRRCKAARKKRGPISVQQKSGRRSDRFSRKLMTAPAAAVASATPAATATAVAPTAATAAVAATATAVAAATAASTTAAAATTGRTCFARTSLVHRQRTTFDSLPIELGDRCLSVCFSSHRHKGEAARLTREFILHERHFLDGSSL